MSGKDPSRRGNFDETSDKIMSTGTGVLDLQT